MPVGRNEGAQIAQASRYLQQQSQQQQQQQQQESNGPAAPRNSLSSSSMSSISSSASLLKERFSRASRRIDNSRRNEMSAMLKQDAIMRAQIRMGV